LGKGERVRRLGVSVRGFLVFELVPMIFLSSVIDERKRRERDRKLTPRDPRSGRFENPG
jgi:inner membrane protein involved in colicin E2 resistance